MCQPHLQRTVRQAFAALLAGMAALGSLSALVGCDSLPLIAPDRARHARAAVQLEGYLGPLSRLQSKAILERLRAQGQDTDIFARHLAMEEAIAGSPLTTGNQVRLLQDGPATYRSMLEAIGRARNHIHMETYIIDDDVVGRPFRQALIDQQARGVQVHLIRDSVGTLFTPAAFFRPMLDSGIRVLEFNPVNPALARKDWVLNQRNHRKLLLVDGRIAFLGGINISSVYSGGSFKPTGRDRRTDQVAWRDTDLQLRGPVVAELQKLFMATWADQKGPPLAALDYFPPPEAAGDHVVRAIGSTPLENYSQIYATLLSAIGSAVTSVHLTSAYFVPDPQLLAALADAVARGVSVNLILPGQTDSWLAFHAGRSHYEALLGAGVRLYERRGVVLHAKTALIDGVWATVGSTNLDWRSFLHNHELNAVVLGATFGNQVRAMFDQDLAVSDEIHLAAWQRRPLYQRLQEVFARTWAYWL